MTTGTGMVVCLIILLAYREIRPLARDRKFRRVVLWVLAILVVLAAVFGIWVVS